MQTTAQQLREALNRKAFITLLGECSIEYDGRAQSYLPYGERLVIIKEDSTVLVHQPQGNNPVNYMKPDTTFRINSKDDELVIECINETMKEYLTITFSSVISLFSQKLKDGGSIVLQGNEKDYSDYLFSHPELIENDFKPLSREEHTKYGFIDLFGYDSDNNLVVVECKRFKAGPDAVTQLRRYVEKIKKDKGLNKVRGIIAAPDITKNALAMMAEYGYTYRKINPPSFHAKHDKNQKKLGEF